MFVNLTRDIDLILWTISISVMSFIGSSVIYKLKYLKIEDKNIYFNVLTWGLFFIFTAIGNTFGLINRLWFWKIPIIRTKIDTISIFFDFLAIAFKIIYIEKSLKIFKKPYFSYYNLIVLILIITTSGMLKSVLYITIIVFILQIIGISILPLLYFYIFIKSSGPIKINTLFILIGFIGLEIALSMQAHNLNIIWPNFPIQFQAIFGFPYLWISPIEVIIFTLFIYRGFKISI